MDKNIIIIKERAEIPSDKDFRAADHLFEATKLLRDDKNSKMINEIFIEQNKKIENYWEGKKQQLTELIPTLHKYWKMTIYNKWESGDEFVQDTYYVHPYKIIRENNTFWCLKIYTDKYKTIEDTCFDFDKINNKIVFEEITEEEFRKQASLQVDKIINYRLEREKN